MVSISRYSIRIILTVITVIVLFGVCLMLLLDAEKVSEKLENYNALQKSESWQKGWVPKLMPTTATNIYVEHDIDTNEVFGEFLVPSFTLEQEVAGIRKLTVEEKTRLLESMPRWSVRRSIGKHTIFNWCDKSEGMLIWLFATDDRRVIYWGNANASCTH